MALKLNSSGGGSVTIDPVSTASNVTISIPATNAGSLVTADSSGNITNSGNLIFGGTGKRITGDFSNATISNRLMFQSSTVNGNTFVFANPNGSGTSSYWLTSNSSDTANAAVAYIGIDSTTATITSSKTGTGTYLPITFYTSGAERMRIDTAGDVSVVGNMQATSYNGGQLAGLRNKIINGNMGIAQRGTAAVTTNLYGPADRWKNDSLGSTFSTTRGSFVGGDTLYDTGGAQYFTTVAVTSVANTANYVKIGQCIEDVRVLAGQTVTVSFWAKAAVATSIGVEIWQSFGTGGTPSTEALGTGQAQAITTTWAKYSKTFTVPSLSGKTIGTTANTSFTVVDFWLESGANGATRAGLIGQASKTVSIAQVQLEIGSVATPFEQRPIGMELALCQRYLPSGNAGVGWAYNLNAGQYLFPFAVLPRVAPTGVTVIAHATLASTGTAQTSNSAVFAGTGSQSAGLLNLSSASNFAAATGQGSTCSLGNYLFTGCEL